MNQKNLDINLLRCLQVLVDEGHVSRAAERLEMTQPAMSAVLSKLRTIFEDPLLVRTGKGMVATQRALDITGQVRDALTLLDQALTCGTEFCPLTSTAHFRFAATESVMLALMPPLVARLRTIATGVTLSVQVPELSRVRQELEDGDADFLLARKRPAFVGLRCAPLFKQRLVVIAAGNHPHIQGSLNLEQYTRYPHCCYVVGRGGQSMVEARLDSALADAGIRRTIGAWLPSALSSPAVVAGSDMLATVPDRVARHFAREYNLQVFDPPLALGPVDIGMYWHERSHNSAAHRWMRERLREAASGLVYEARSVEATPS